MEEYAYFNGNNIYIMVQIDHKNKLIRKTFIMIANNNAKTIYDKKTEYAVNRLVTELLNKGYTETQPTEEKL